MIKKKLGSKTQKKLVSAKTVDIHVSPSRAYLATQCLQWQNIKSGQRLLSRPKNLQNGVNKHAEIEKDISIVKSYLPVGVDKMEVYQELPLEAVAIRKNFRLTIRGFADCVIFDKSKKKLYVYDWKTGGSQVQDVSEEQLILYAFAAIEKYLVNDVELIYVNPDYGTSMTKNFTPNEIEEKVFEIVEKIGEQLSRGFTVGNHCEYCPARSACPELLKNLELLISPEVNGKKIEHFSEMQLDLIKIGTKVLEELKDRLKMYLSFNPDRALHGYALVDRKGIKAIRQDTDLKIFAEKLGTSPDSLFEKKLLSVKQLEDRGLPLESVSEFIIQPTTKVLKKI